MRKSFKIIIHRKAAKELNGLTANMRNRIIEALREKEANPFAGDIKPVKGLRGMFRRRVGDYRIIFTINFEESVIVILRIGHRERVYEKDV